MRWCRWPTLFIVVLVATTVVGCAGPVPHRPIDGVAEIDCAMPHPRDDDPCARRTPEVSKNPPYRLHFVEIDDQGWLYPGPAESGHTDGMGIAHAHIDRAIDDVSAALTRGERVMLFVFVHGWKHGAGYDDRDVQRFRDMLADAASGARFASPPGQPVRTVVGIYIGWRGGGGFSAQNPLVYATFWTRKNAALHISGGSSRELFARLRALRQRWNTPPAGASPEDRQRALQHPKLRTIVLGHSFGGWVAFAALSPSVLELLAHAVDRDRSDGDTVWLAARVSGTADMIVLLNPAFEATRYQPLHSMSRRVQLSRFEAPVLVIITSTADWATRMAFPLGRRVNTLFQRMVSPEEEEASVKTPGFIPSYRTHQLTRLDPPTVCEGWRPSPPAPSKETDAERVARAERNVALEIDRHRAWVEDLGTRAGVMGPDWSWEYCGGTTVKLLEGVQPHVPVWNIVTDKSVIGAHSDIAQEPLHAYLRQLYMNLSR